MAPSCTHCQKSPPEVVLRRCAKCSATPYCSRDCQKADWKVHKKICGRQASGAAPSSRRPGAATLSPPKGVERGVAFPFSRLDNDTWLHDRPEKDVYGLLIDAYRLRVEDMCSFEGEVDADGIYGGADNGLPGFQRFLARVASCPGLLPPWWNDAKKRDCEALGMEPAQWYDLGCAVEKSDIIENYGDPQFPMQLRMFAERVYGRAPGGTNGAPMRQMMVAMEQGAARDMQTSLLDVSASVGRL
ncbi:Zinc finger, MYND-type [Metarhizium album ARSEF 1941]|uniref:Zinc finger, MYND-type n=1 Tax=Metarhizium album (strain ARSEF 1941) TaxID=1081103 RepID=A0A0B2WNZ5_METAS|nr:Zinc finger, MYND-type [Metarhizium album ARSEF 1941]KHN95384.1 Zinc finger, MYND-type [Metarhizium album ARSEF 1941]